MPPPSSTLLSPAGARSEPRQPSARIDKKKVERILQRLEALRLARSERMGDWEELASHFPPRAGRFFTSDRNRSKRDAYRQIIDNTGRRGLRTLTAGLFSTASSPARPWFRLATADPELDDYRPVAIWLAEVVRRMLQVFARSNTYNVLHQCYEELGLFGQAVDMVLSDERSVIHNYPMTAGEYFLAQDFRGRVNTCYRELEITVRQCVEEFGKHNCSIAVQDRYNKADYEGPVTIIHAIEPRPQDEREYGKADPYNMPWASCYLEKGIETGQFLRESGFRSFPVLAPRWNLQVGEVYGEGPAMDALSSVRQLQHQQLRKAQAIDYQTKPPLQMPTRFKDRDQELFPGGQTYITPAQLLFADQVTPNGGIRTAFEVNLDLNALQQDMVEVRQRIDANFFTDLWIMLNYTGPDSRRTAYEVAELQQEKLQMLGPAVERLQHELFEPLIDRGFEGMAVAGLLPPPPQELLGMDLRVEHISTLAQAQRMVGAVQVDRFVGSLASIAQWKPEAADKFNADKWVDLYQDMLGVPPELVVDDDRVNQIRQARAKMLAAKEQLAAQQAQSVTAKNLASAQTGPGQNALTDVMDLVTGYNSPGSVQVA